MRYQKRCSTALLVRRTRGASADDLVKDVPLFFGLMDALQILELPANRLTKGEILNIVTRTIEPVSPSLQALSENRREAAVTRVLEEWMKRESVATGPTDRVKVDVGTKIDVVSRSSQHQGRLPRSSSFTVGNLLSYW